MSIVSRDKSKLKYMQSATFVLKDGSHVKGLAGDSCVITESLYGKDRVDISWSEVEGFIVDNHQTLAQYSYIVARCNITLSSFNI